MNILFRAEGKAAEGLGHLVRCLSVAESLRGRYADQKPDMTFVTDDDELTLDMIGQSGFKTVKKPAGQEEESFLAAAVAEAGGAVLVIDMLHPYSPAFIGELKTRIAVAVILNSPQAVISPDALIVPGAHLPDDMMDSLAVQTVKGTKLYEGFDYVVMNDDVMALQGEDASLPGGNRSLRVVITTGGADPKGILIRVLEWMHSYAGDSTEIWALVGSAFQHQDELTRMQPRLPGNFQIIPYDPARLPGADLAICAFGITTYELMYLGIPSICIGHAGPNARGSGILARRYHATVDLGHIDDLTEERFLSNLDRYIKHAEERRQLSERSKALLDGNGAHRIANIVYELGLGRHTRVSAVSGGQAV